MSFCIYWSNWAYFL